MSVLEAKKDPRLFAAIDALREALGVGSFMVIDHWPDDPHAVGVASPLNEHILAYISVSSGSDEPYFVSLEHPPSGEWSDHLYTPEEDRNICELDELVEIVAKHLRSKPSSH
jgi:hypothetical protein